jgi:hypothetical protein
VKKSTEEEAEEERRRKKEGRCVRDVLCPSSSHEHVLSGSRPAPAAAAKFQDEDQVTARYR